MAHGEALAKADTYFNAQVVAIPVVIYMLGFKRGTIGQNEYGRDPIERNGRNNHGERPGTTP